MAARCRAARGVPSQARRTRPGAVDPCDRGAPPSSGAGSTQQLGDQLLGLRIGIDIQVGQPPGQQPIGAPYRVGSVECCFGNNAWSSSSGWRIRSSRCGQARQRARAVACLSTPWSLTGLTYSSNQERSSEHLASTQQPCPVNTPAALGMIVGTGSSGAGLVEAARDACRPGGWSSPAKRSDAATARTLYTRRRRTPRGSHE